MDLFPIALPQPLTREPALAPGQPLAAGLIGDISDPLEIIANLVYLARRRDILQEDRETFLTIAGDNVAAIADIIQRYAVAIRSASGLD